MAKQTQGEVTSRPVKKTYDYAAYIEEIRKLRDQASSALWYYSPDGELELREADLESARTGDPHGVERWKVSTSEFQMWLEQVKHHVAEIKRLNYPVKIKFTGRDFVTPNGDYEYVDSKVGRQRAFLRDLEDTIREMSVVIEQFDSYGTPADSYGNKSNASATSATAFPQRTENDPEKFFIDKPSLKWLITNLPVNWWVFICTLLGGAFGAGVLFDHYVTPSQVVQESSKQAQPATLPTPSSPTPTVATKPASAP